MAINKTTNNNKGPCIPNFYWMNSAGIDPKTGFPIKAMLGDSGYLKKGIKMQLRDLDKKTAINKGKWYNIPLDISSQFLEKMLYYKYKLCLFYNKPLDRFFILPFTLSTTPDGGNGLDEFGRYTRIKPIAYVAGSDADEKQHKNTALEDYLSKLSLKVIYSPVDTSMMTREDLIDLTENSAVILMDYSPGLAYNDSIPRSVMNEPLLDMMSECLPYVRTNLLTSCGVKGIRVGESDAAHNVKDANDGIKQAAMLGDAYVPIEGKMEFQELTDNNTGKVQDYFLALQSLENYRLMLHGIDNGGLFEKKAQELNAEAAINGGPIGLIAQDFTSIRQDFCNIVNSIWPIGIWYEPSENLSMADTNGDGLLYDRNETGENSGLDTGGSSDDSNV
ncbi:MAG: hypothetical protein J6Y28_08705 [Acholeplasmatales bacterium]|nr:hypothetical protein [Acholeplasmatales bacterium]